MGSSFCPPRHRRQIRSARNVQHALLGNPTAALLTTHKGLPCRLEPGQTAGSDRLFNEGHGVFRAGGPLADHATSRSAQIGDGEHARRFSAKPTFWTGTSTGYPISLSQFECTARANSVGLQRGQAWIKTTGLHFRSAFISVIRSFHFRFWPVAASNCAALADFISPLRNCTSVLGRTGSSRLSRCR